MKKNYPNSYNIYSFNNEINITCQVKGKLKKKKSSIIRNKIYNNPKEEVSSGSFCFHNLVGLEQKKP